MKDNSLIKILLLSFLFVLPLSVFAWDDCPYGKVDDAYPGDCKKYIDTDGDGICDRSQLAPEDRNNASEQSDTDINAQDLGIEDPKDVINTNNSPGEEEAEHKKYKISYYLLPISIILIFLYLLTYILSKLKILSVSGHRKIWNILLLATFLISGILGIVLTINLSSNFIIPLPVNILFWHVEAGIAMFAISIFHIIWHWRYFINLFKIKK